MSEPNRLRRIPTSLHRRILASRVVSYCVEKKPAKVYFDTQAHRSHSRQQLIFQTCGSIATDSLMLLFAQYKCDVAYRWSYQHSRLAALLAKSAFNSATKRLLP